MIKIKKYIFVISSSFLVLVIAILLGNAIFWREGIHAPGDLAIETVPYAFFILTIYLWGCATYFVDDIKRQNRFVAINFISFIFFGSTLLGSIINLGSSNYNSEEISDFAVSFSMVVTLIFLIITPIVYFKNKNKDIRPKKYIELLNKIPMFKSIKIGKNIESQVNVEEKRIKHNNPVKEPFTEVSDNVEVDYDKVLLEVRKRISVSEELKPDTTDYFSLYEIDTKIYNKAKNYYSRSIFKNRLNPCSKEDREVLNWEEIKFLNGLGLIEQEKEFPYMVTIIEDSKTIDLGFKFQMYKKDRIIYIPDIDELDKLKNGFEFEEYVVNFLKEQEYLEIEKLSNFDKNGADILALKNNIRYAFKCKYFTKPVGISAVKEVIKGSTYHYARVPVVVTNSTFNDNAKKHGELYNVQLWDRYYLIENKNK